MALIFTPHMKKRLTQRALDMLERSLGHFPELQGKTVTVGLTRKHLGSATISYRAGVISRLTIRLRARKVSYQTIGHELTHLVQGLGHGDRSAPGSTTRSKIPSGEKQCDIWTLARHPLFCDDPPTYIKLPRIVRDQWPRYAESVRSLCVAAIEKRPSHRLYIRWLESEIRRLSRRLPEKKLSEQMELPFIRSI
ncbi:MAG TPA: hypothetical protein VIE89_02310 [Candidatus Binatia bacterium]